MRRSLRQEAQTPTVLLRSEVCFLHFIWGLHTTPFSALWVRFGFGLFSWAAAFAGRSDGGFKIEMACFVFLENTN